jgi:hypothetical protein
VSASLPTQPARSSSSRILLIFRRYIETVYVVMTQNLSPAKLDGMKKDQKFTDRVFLGKHWVKQVEAHLDSRTSVGEMI